jgi:IclR family acetate operon transcriptional repressor
MATAHTDIDSAQPAGKRGSREEPARKRGYDVGVLIKALNLFELIGTHEGLGLSELAERSGYDKATTYRILQTLSSRGFVHMNEAKGYNLGLKALMFFSHAHEHNNAFRELLGLLDRALERFKETANLGAIEDVQIAYLQVVESPFALRMAAQTGSRDPITTTAIGKAILARMDSAESRSLVQEVGLVRRSPNSITNYKDLAKELKATRNRGYALDLEENEIDAHCVGAAIEVPTSGAILGFSISGAVRTADEGSAQRSRRVAFGGNNET